MAVFYDVVPSFFSVDTVMGWLLLHFGSFGGFDCEWCSAEVCEGNNECSGPCAGMLKLHVMPSNVGFGMPDNDGILGFRC